jgi:hypothetical protein
LVVLEKDAPISVKVQLKVPSHLFFWLVVPGTVVVICGRVVVKDCVIDHAPETWAFLDAVEVRDVTN